jgi:hypothetical protein
MSVPGEIKESEMARVMVDALAGLGLILFQGEFVRREVFGEYFDALIAKGALELCVPIVSPGKSVAADLI